MANPKLQTVLVTGPNTSVGGEQKKLLFENIRAEPNTGVQIQISSVRGQLLAQFDLMVPDTGILELGFAVPLVTGDVSFSPIGENPRPFLLNYVLQN